MAQTIKLKRSSVAGNVPGSSDLSLGEIALNTADGAVYIKKGNNDIVAVADNDILHIDTTNSRVGIGLTNPAATFQVNGSIVSEGGSFASAQETATDAGLIIQKNDFIYSDDNSYLRRIIGHTSAGIEIGQGGTSLISDIILKPGTSGNIRFFASGSEDVRINSSGNVGIKATAIDDGDLQIGDANSAFNIAIAGPRAKFGYSGDNAIVQGGTAKGIAFCVNTSTLGSGEAARFDSSGNLLVGKTSLGVTDVGVEARGNGLFAAAKASGAAGYFTRTTDDGDIVKFYKDGTTVGSIGVANTNNLFIGSTATDHAGIQFGTNTLIPETAGTQSNGLVDLGQSGGRFKDLHLSGTANVGGLNINSAYTFPTADGSANQVLKTDGSGNLTFAASSGGGVSISNNVNNRVLTGDGTNANAEANLTFDGSTLGVTGNITASSINGGSAVEADSMFINTPDGGSAPAITALFKIYGYEGRGAGIKIRDNANSASNASNREWFIGSGYNQSGFNIGYSATGSQSSYTAQNKFALDTSGNATFAGTVDGRDVATDGTKLDTIETSATADQTAAEILAALKTVDVNGTAGVNAGTVDGFTALVNS